MVSAFKGPAPKLQVYIGPAQSPNRICVFAAGLEPRSETPHNLLFARAAHAKARCGLLACSAQDQDSPVCISCRSAGSGLLPQNVLRVACRESWAIWLRPEDTGIPAVKCSFNYS